MSNVGKESVLRMLLFFIPCAMVYVDAKIQSKLSSIEVNSMEAKKKSIMIRLMIQGVVLIVTAVLCLLFLPVKPEHKLMIFTCVWVYVLFFVVHMIIVIIDVYGKYMKISLGTNEFLIGSPYTNMLVVLGFLILYSIMCFDDRKKLMDRIANNIDNNLDTTMKPFAKDIPGFKLPNIGDKLGNMTSNLASKIPGKLGNMKSSLASKIPKFAGKKATDGEFTNLQSINTTTSETQKTHDTQNGFVSTNDKTITT